MSEPSIAKTKRRKSHMKKFLAAAVASVMLVGGAALAAADGELNICSPNSDGLLSIIPVFEEQTGIKVMSSPSARATA